MGSCCSIHKQHYQLDENPIKEQSSPASSKKKFYNKEGFKN